jgi:hypothetical protein
MSDATETTSSTWTASTGATDAEPVNLTMRQLIYLFNLISVNCSVTSYAGEMDDVMERVAGPTFDVIRDALTKRLDEYEMSRSVRMQFTVTPE